MTPITLNNEARKVFQLTDKELLEILQHRQGELVIAEAFASLVRALEVSISLHPSGELGLRQAISITKLMAQKYATGHEDHPFRNFDIAKVALETTGGITVKPTLPDLKFSYSNSKTSRCVQIIMSYPANQKFRPFDIMQMQAMKDQPDLQYVHMQDALNRMQTDKRIVKISHGMYMRRDSGDR